MNEKLKNFIEACKRHPIRTCIGLFIVGFFIISAAMPPIKPSVPTQTSAPIAVAKNVPAQPVAQPAPTPTIIDLTLAKGRQTYNSDLGNNADAADFSKTMMKAAKTDGLDIAVSTNLTAPDDANTQYTNGGSLLAYQLAVHFANTTIVFTNPNKWDDSTDSIKKDLVTLFLKGLHNRYPAALLDAQVSNGIRTVADGEWVDFSNDPNINLK